MHQNYWRQKMYLLTRLARVEIHLRYGESMLGLAWAVVTPLLMLAVYGFVFSVVLEAKWPGLLDSQQDGFVLLLFSGLILFNLAAECWIKAPRLILENPSYVKKVAFPLHLLPLSALTAPLLQAAASFAILFAAYPFIFGVPPLTVLLLPFLLLFYVLFLLGISYLLAAAGVVLRDLQQILGIFMTVVLFLSPVFYPLSAVPEKFQFIILMNPLTYFMEATKDLLYWGQWLDPSHFLVAATGSAVFAYGAYWAFDKAHKEFADVL